MRRVWSFVVVLAACGGKPPPSSSARRTNPGAAYAAMSEPRRPADAPPRTYNTNTIHGWSPSPLPDPFAPDSTLAAAPPTPVARATPLVPRPTIDFSIYTIDFHDELRWPLSSMSHPSLEPHFAIVQALAEPGVSLEKLCSLGAQSRHGVDRELDAYLRGWCGAIAGDVDKACSQLGPLLGSTTSGLRAAVTADLPNILADHGDADDAEHWLRRHHIESTEILDRLAATYVETGTTADAVTINRLAMQTSDRGTLATRCMRIARDILLEGNRDELSLAPLRTFGEPKDRRASADPTCAQLFHKLQCWADLGCDGFYRDQHTTKTGFLYLRQAYERWPQANRPADWRTIAGQAMIAIPASGALALALAAFENGMEADAICDVDESKWLDEHAKELAVGFAEDPTQERIYRRLRARCP